MEARQPDALHLEMTDLEPAAYRALRAGTFGDASVALFANCVRDRADLPRTIPEFDLLAVAETAADAPMPTPEPAIHGGYRFVRTARPGQGSISDEPTDGLQLVLISPRDPARAQELRDWGDFVHIRHIAESAVPGFRMITPYVNARAGRPGAGPWFLHFYEMHTADPEAAFLDMTPRVAVRLGGTDTDAYRDWAWHPQLRIDYVNTFRRVSVDSSP